MKRTGIKIVAGLSTAACLVLALLTAASVHRPPDVLPPECTTEPQALVVDRNGVPLMGRLTGGWNTSDRLKLWQLPEFLRAAVVASEDRRFFSHDGVDWRARAAALGENLRAGKIVRGASTIPEQIAKILTPRPRTLWSRWLEGIEASLLTTKFSKEELLEFYLNQVPYAGNRRGVRQAARYYFARDVESLSRKEMLALVVLMRAPSRWDLWKASSRIESPLRVLARRLTETPRRDGSMLLEPGEYDELCSASLKLVRPSDTVEAQHFVRFAKAAAGEPSRDGIIRTTLDAGLQQAVQPLLDERVRALAAHDVSDGAVLVVDHLSDEVLAWVNAGRFFAADEGSQFDAVRLPRQPGSLLKPFLYAQALELGWTPATLIEDSEYSKSVGQGEHIYHNYSRTHYGPVRLREALGNSLNIPAVRTAEFIGTSRFLDRLRAAGVSSLNRQAAHYGEGLALGNGEISLYELVRAYAILARQGIYRELSVLKNAPPQTAPRQVFAPEAASLIADIISDPEARSLEFGQGAVLELPVQTAVKTGTSSDFRDAWTIGFSHRFTVGVWLGNLSARPMRDVSGSLGPALVLRAVFAELERHADSKALELSRDLHKVRICRETGKRASSTCPSIDELFAAGTEPREVCGNHGSVRAPSVLPVSSPENGIEITHPTPGLHLALDPRIPDSLEKYEFRLGARDGVEKVDWFVDDLPAQSSPELTHLWQVTRGEHRVRASVWLSGQTEAFQTAAVDFVVK